MPSSTSSSEGRPTEALAPQVSEGDHVNSHLVGISLLGKRTCRRGNQESSSADNLNRQPLIGGNEEWHLESKDLNLQQQCSRKDAEEEEDKQEPQRKKRRLSLRNQSGEQTNPCTHLNSSAVASSSPSSSEEDDYIRPPYSSQKEGPDATNEESYSGSTSASARNTPEATLAYLDGVRVEVAACQEEGDLMMARVYLQDALPAATRASELDICSASYLAQHFLAQLGDTCYQLGDCAEAIDFYTAAVKNERLVHQHSEKLFGYMEAICRIYVELRQYSYALCVFKELYDLQVEAKGPDSLEVASTLCNMALMHYQLELYTPSLHFYQETLRISLTRLEDLKRNPVPSDETATTVHALNKSIADSLNAMGLLYFKLKRFGEAASAFGCSLAIREKQLGQYHRDVTVLWYNLAMVRVQTGDPRRAIPLYEEGLRREKVQLGGNHLHPALSSTLQYLGELYNQLGEIEESFVCFQQALEIEIQQAKLQVDKPRAAFNKETDHWASVCRLLNVIGNIHLMQADIPATMKCFVEAARTASMLLQTRNEYIPLVVAGHMLCHLTRLHPSCASAA